MTIADRVARWRTVGLTFLEDVLSLPDGRSYGASLDSWQRQDFAAAFGANKHVWWERPRGHSKTMDGGAFALHRLLSGPGRRLYFAAVDRDQAALAHDSLRGFINRSESLQASLKVDRWRVAAPSTDSTLEVLAADAASSWGLRPSLVVCDELQAWRGDAAEELFYALYSALGKVTGARMLVSTTAGWDRTSLCWKLREQVKDDPAWVFSRIGQSASWVSPEFLAQQRRLLPEQVFRRLHLNEWTEGSGSFVTREQLDRCIDPTWAPQLAGAGGLRYFVGLDLGLTRDRTARAVVHYDRDAGKVALDDLRVWQGTRAKPVVIEQVEEDLIAVKERFRDPVFYLDPWQLQSTLQRLRGKLRLEPFTFTTESVRRLSENLYQLLRNAKLRLYSDAELERELLQLEMVQTGYGWRIDHRSGGFSDRAVAIGMAALGAIVEGARGGLDLLDEPPTREDLEDMGAGAIMGGIRGRQF